MLCTPFRKASIEDRKHLKQSRLSSKVAEIADAQNNCDYSKVVSLCAEAIILSNELADLFTNN